MAKKSVDLSAWSTKIESKQCSIVSIVDPPRKTDRPFSFISTLFLPLKSFVGQMSRDRGILIGHQVVHIMSFGRQRWYLGWIDRDHHRRWCLIRMRRDRIRMMMMTDGHWHSFIFRRIDWCQKRLCGRRYLMAIGAWDSKNNQKIENQINHTSHRQKYAGNQLRENQRYSRISTITGKTID